MDTNGPQSKHQPGSSQGIRTIAPNESWTFLRQSVVGRLAVVHDEAPDIFPVNYIVDHGTVVVRTGGGTKHNAARNHVVAFEVDGQGLDPIEAWSVVIRGRATEVYAVDEVIEIMNLPLSSAPGAKPHFLRITPDSITGRRFVVTDGMCDAVRDA